MPVIAGMTEGGLLDAIAASVVPDMQEGDVSIVQLAAKMDCCYDVAKRTFYQYADDHPDEVEIVDAREPKTGKVIKVMRTKTARG